MKNKRNLNIEWLLLRNFKNASERGYNYSFISCSLHVYETEMIDKAYPIGPTHISVATIFIHILSMKAYTNANSMSMNSTCNN